VHEHGGVEVAGGEFSGDVIEVEADGVDALLVGGGVGRNLDAAAVFGE
jgi:hypothetical protein